MNPQALQLVYAVQYACAVLNRACHAVTLTNNQSPGLIARYYAAKARLATALGASPGAAGTSVDLPEAYRLTHSTTRLLRAAQALTLTNNPSAELLARYNLEIDATAPDLGGGGVTDPLLAKALSALAQAPLQASSLQFVDVTALTPNTPGARPPFPNPFRHGIHRTADNEYNPLFGAVDFDQIVYAPTRDLWARSNNNTSVPDSDEDETNFDHMSPWHPDPNGDQPKGSMGSMTYGFTHTGRYLAVSSRTFCSAHWEVDGKLVRPMIRWADNDIQMAYDFGSVATRNVVFHGSDGFWGSGFTTQRDDIVVPYNFMTNRLKAGFLSDSFGFAKAYGLVGMNYLDLLSKLMGFGTYQASAIGGTGFAAANEAEEAGDYIGRRQFIIDTNPDVVVIDLGLNDSWPTYSNLKDTGEAIATTIAGFRTALPNALLVVKSAYSPAESQGANPASAQRGVRSGQLATLAETAGPWVFIDALDGTWLTSNGKSKAVPTGPWQTGDGYVGNETGIGNGDTWVSSDGTHLTEAGVVGLANLLAASYREAVTALALG